MYHGGGGFKHEEVYNMPTWMRIFHIEKINEYHQKQQEEYDKQVGKGDIGDHFPPSDQKWKNKPSKFFMDFSKNF